MQEQERLNVDVNLLVDRLYTLAVTILGEGRQTDSLVERVFAEGWDVSAEDETERIEEALVRAFYRQAPDALDQVENSRSTPPTDLLIALRTFPTQAAIPLLLIDLLGWPYSRVARALEVDVDQVKVVLTDARRRLQGHLLHRND